jgi:cytochrome-b5 reductase
VTEEMIRKYCPKPAGGDSKILLCGPPPMIKAMSAHCEAIGFARPRVVSKMEDEVFKF